VAPRRVVHARGHGRGRRGPLDSYWLELLRKHEPDTAARLREVAIDRLDAAADVVAAGGSSPTCASSWRARWSPRDRRMSSPTCGTTLALSGFARPDPRSYAVLAERARAADALGYPALQ
jgi:hypothetical protein